MDTAIGNGGLLSGEDGKPYSIDGIYKALQQVKMCLEIKKGDFIFMPSLGSELWRLDSSKPYLEKQADMFVREALMRLKNIYIESVSVEKLPEGVNVTVNIEYTGKKGSVEVTVNG
ncbi:MAG: hypothetical protein ACI4II_10175 [Acutalibacteraceae bacterium]